MIYLALIVYAIYQVLPKQRTNPRLRATGWWVVLSGVANSVWIFLWHYEQFPLTLLVMLVLLVSLIAVYLKLGTGRTAAPAGERWFVRLPFSLYLGWITVATVANVTSLLDYLKWNGFGIAPETWMWIVLGAVLLIAALMNFTRRDVVYTLVILWALVGIALKFSTVALVATPTWVAAGLVALTLVIALLVPHKKLTLKTGK